MPETLSNRLPIAFFGRHGAGRSSLIKTLAGSASDLVSPLGGPSGEPLITAAELPMLGPVALLDMPGLDDPRGLCPLIAERVRDEARLAVLVLDPHTGVGAFERSLLGRLTVPIVAVVTKSDTARLDDALPDWEAALGTPILSVSARTGRGITELADLLGTAAASDEPPEPDLLGELVAPGDVVVLVTPLDLASSEGRLAPTHARALGEILARDATALVVKQSQLAHALHQLGRRPDLVITDARAFRHVADALPWGVPLTSFSILEARQQGVLERLVAEARAQDAIGHNRPFGDLWAELVMAHRQGFLGRALAPLSRPARERGEEPLVTWSPV